MRRVLALLALVVMLSLSAQADAAKPKLRRFASCKQLVTYGKRHAPRWSPNGPPPAAVPTPPLVAAPGAGGPAGEVTAPVPPAATPGEDFSVTNVQEAGVHEPDIVKTNGTTLYAVEAGRLHVVDVSSGAPEELGTLALGTGYGHQLLLRGDRLLVTWTQYGDGAPLAQAARAPSPAPPTVAPKTVIALVDVSDPAHPALTKTLSFAGDLVAARAVGASARLVLATLPRAIVQPASGRAATGAWLPRGTFATAGSGKARSRPLVGCRSVRRPRSFSGLGEVTVLTIDMDKGLEPVDADGLLSGGETVYASKDSLFVASQRYQPRVQSETGGPVPQDTTTQIHRFDIADPDVTTYAGSGQVPGYLLSQFAMSERAGVLRVASTEEPPWFAEAGTSASQSHLTTLQESATGLAPLGRVSGLGAGERIYAVRYVDDAAFVVTFRQVDPLFALDLSDPAKPRVSGELKLLGVSSYLHPAGDGRLIGVGQDASEQGRTQGTQVSLFDVSDLAAPKLLQRAALGQGASSTAEYEHHAFLWWPKRDLAVLPASIYDGAGQVFSGAIGFTVRDDGITQAGSVTHDGVAIDRSLVIGDRLYTLSPAGLKASALSGFGDVGFVRFAGAASGGAGSATPPSP